MRLHLYRATVDNADRFIDAGGDIEVGDEAEQIVEARALELLATGGAIDPDEPEPDILDLSADQLAHDLSAEAVGAHVPDAAAAGVDGLGGENTGQ